MYPNQDAIFERLETTKQSGLLSDYLVSWTGRSGRLRAKVTVWGKDGTPGHVVERYIAQLLKGLVPPPDGSPLLPMTFGAHSAASSPSRCRERNISERFFKCAKHYRR